jgi:2,4-dienoyl-CoA reductase-like NADH-dependent reductase (Old Yellow Enzyme family)
MMALMLDAPLTLPSGLVLKNRFAKSAISEGLAELDGQPNHRHVALYRRWAEGGTGLLVTGNIMVDGRFLERPGNVIIEDDSALTRLAAWAEAAKACGAHTIVQLSHPGRQTQRFVSSEPVAPSAVPAVKVLASFARPRALREDEIIDIIERFAVAASVVQRAGFSGVQIHAAHGYLVSQFLSPILNLRRDQWGGGLEGRSRFLIEIVRAVRARVGREFTIAVKLNSADFQRGGFGEDEALEVVRLLEREGIDLLEISGGSYEQPTWFGASEGAVSTHTREAYFLEFARKVRFVSKLPLMVTGGFRSRRGMQAALDEGAVDVIGLARPLILEPALSTRLLERESAQSPAMPRPFRIRALAALAEAAWFWRQLWRIAHGRDPSPGLVFVFSIALYVLRDSTRGLAHRWRTPSGSRVSPARVDLSPGKSS